MEDLQKIALAYFAAAPPNVKRAAENFLRELDRDGDGRVSLAEFLTFARENALIHLHSRDTFNQLNLTGTGKLNKQEVLLMLYIVCSGRPACEGCGILIGGIFFTCIKCYDNVSNPSFNLCTDCFIKDNYVHGHEEFLDNVLLLYRKRAEHMTGNTVNIRSSSQTRFSGQQSSSQTIVVYNPQNKKNIWVSVAKATLHVGASVAAIASQLCTIM